MDEWTRKGVACRQTGRPQPAQQYDPAETSVAASGENIRCGRIGGSESEDNGGVMKTARGGAAAESGKKKKKKMKRISGESRSM